jgi:hypothetical protein
VSNIKERKGMVKLGRAKKILFLFGAIAVVVFFCVAVKADIGEPGSQTDPIVSKSYVDKVFLELKNYIDSKKGESSDLEIVYLEEGQKLIGDKGTEIILRSGSARIIDSIYGGLADVTSGKDLKEGENAPQNHLLIVPRDDGRGLITDSNVVVMVKGNYSISD